MHCTHGARPCHCDAGRLQHHWDAISLYAVSRLFDCSIVLPDAYLHLNRLGTNCEMLPEAVLFSPAERDSSWSASELPVMSGVNEDEIRFLRAQLEKYRREHG